jgi:integrase
MKLPRYVHGFVDRHGKARYYFRRAGFKKVPLQGLPWSPEFMATYAAAQAEQPAPIAAARVLPGSIHALAASYYGSPEFLGMKANSQRVRRNIIERFLRETDANGQRNADKRAALLQRDHIIRFMAARSSKPESANGLRKALRAMMQHAVAMKIRADDPTQGVKRIKSPSEKIGFHTWTEEEITQFAKHHPKGRKAHLAMALGLFTGQARQDVVAMGPQHIRDEVLHWTRKKTAHSTALNLFIPVLPDLRSVLDATSRGHLTFLVTEFGKPFTAAGFGNWFRDRCDEAGLPRCTFHGLRKSASRRLAEHGCTPHEIAAITGHATLKEIERYTKDAERRRLAQSAMNKLKSRTGNG